MAETTASTLTRTVDGVELPPPGTFALDASHTHVGFAVRHLMVSKVRGRFASLAGTVTVAPDPLESSVEVSVDVASVDTREEARDAHLRSPDFFDAERYPTMTFRSSKVTSKGGARYLVDGELTIRGVTRPVALDVDFEGVVADPWGNERIGFSARTEIDREDFGLTWNQALETGGVVVGKKVTIDIEAEAVRQS
jgi:polyisoprenoid-binding protein YceI